MFIISFIFQIAVNGDNYGAQHNNLVVYTSKH